MVISVGELGKILEVRPDLLTVQFQGVPTWVFFEEVESFVSRFELID